MADEKDSRFGLTPEEDRIYAAAYAASLTRTMGFWLLAVIGLCLVPILSGGVFALMLMVGMVLLFFAIPIRALLWRKRHATLPQDHPEMRQAHLMIRHGIILWLLSPVAFILAVFASAMIHGRPADSPTTPPAAHQADSPKSSSAGVHAVDPDLPRLGELVHVDEPPEPITKVPPIYPDEARAADVQGTVVVQALVGKDGLVKDVRVKTSIPMLDEAALQAVLQWTFRPAKSKGAPVSVWVSVPVRFTLR